MEQESLLQEGVRAILQKNSGGMKMTALVVEVIRDTALLQVFSSDDLAQTLEDRIAEMPDVDILDYAYPMGEGVTRVKQFVYFKLEIK